MMFDAQSVIKLVEKELETSGSLSYLHILDWHLWKLRHEHSELSKRARTLQDEPTDEAGRALLLQLSEVEMAGRYIRVRRDKIALSLAFRGSAKTTGAPQLGERILLLLLTREERVNIPGDLEEEFKQIAAKHGARYAKLWYYKQVAASAWPMVRKAVRWGLLAWVEEWIRRRV